MNDLIALAHQQFPRPVSTHSLPSAAFPSGTLGHFNLLLLVEQHYAVRFEPQELAELKSLADIQQALQSKGVAV